jgi:hypothetical protein
MRLYPATSAAIIAARRRRTRSLAKKPPNGFFAPEIDQFQG